MDFNFTMPVRVISGEGAVKNHAEDLCALGKSCLIVTGGSSAVKSGALEDITSVLTARGVEFEIFDKIGQNPLVSDCYAAGRRAAELKCDFMIGIGGGSPLDAAKAAAIFATNDMPPEDIFLMDYKNKPLPLVLVGTTAGTGSEVTAVSVLTVDSSGRKKSITSPDCYARLAFADPRYTWSAPFQLTVSTALDAISHAAEGFLSPNCGDIAAMYASAAIPMVWRELYALKDGKLPDAEGRERLYYGSLYAGMVLNACGTAFPHPMGYVLTEDFGVPHGRACAAYLPALFRRAERFSPERTSEFFSLIGATMSDFSELVMRLADIGSVRMTMADAEKYAQRWDNLKNFKNTPGGFSQEEALMLAAELFVK